MPDGVNIPGGPSFAGSPQPPDVPCDPTGEAWRGPPGPAGPQGVPGPLPPGAPFLPLSGGTVTGDTSITNASLRLNYAQNATTRGGYYNNFASVSGSLSGAATSGADYAVSLLQITSDTLDVGSGLVGHYIRLTAGGTGTAGNRLGQYIDTQFTGSMLDKVRGWPAMYGGQWIYAKASGNVGGTALNNAYGSLWGGLSSATLQSGATFWSYCIGHEIDVGVSTGASAPFVQGLKVVLQNHNQASNATDYLLGMAKTALTDVPIANGITFGSPDGYWPIASGGTLIGTLASVLATPPPRTAANGVDLSAVTFTGSAFKSPGFAVNSLGGVVTSGGVHMGSTAASGTTDFSKHVDLYGGTFGINVTGDSNVNYGGSGGHALYTGTTRLALFTTGGLTLSAAIHFPVTVASNVTDFSKQIDLYNGQAGITVTSDTNINYVGFGGHIFYAGATQLAGIGTTAVTSLTGFQCGGFAGPTWTTGSAAPAATAPVGSLYSRVGGAVGATLYVSRGGGTWAAVAGV